MQLEPYTAADGWLIEALEMDPRVMAELGGPWPAERIPAIHRRRLERIAEGAWYLKVVPEPGRPPVGVITIWQSEWDGKPISEAGWMVLPEHQGRGHASKALQLLLDMARADGRWGDIHAFPGVANGPSNALCRRFGFRMLGEVEVDYGGRVLRCNHWVLPAGDRAAAAMGSTATSARGRELGDESRAAGPEDAGHLVTGIEPPAAGA